MINRRLRLLLDMHYLVLIGKAILDYFRTWRLDADEFEQASAVTAVPPM